LTNAEYGRFSHIVTSPRVRNIVVTTDFLTIICSEGASPHSSPLPGGLNIVMHAARPSNPRGTFLKLTTLAHQQLAGVCFIPWDYYARMLRDAPNLCARNLNQWLHEAPSRRLLCVEGDVLAAFLNAKFIGIAGDRIEHWDEPAHSSGARSV
jgi:hypothetical protein